MTHASAFLQNTTLAIVLLAILSPEVCGEATAGSVRSYPVRLEGCPSELRLQIPAQFSRARGSEEEARRDSILDRLHSNPGRKARYSDVFLSDWNAETGLPQIFVASLGSVIKRQGQIHETEWKQLKKEFLDASQTQRDQWIAQGIENLKPGRPAEIEALKGQITKVTEEQSNSIVTLGTSTAVVSGRTLEYQIAGKLIYSKHCVAYVITGVDASRRRAIEELIQFVSLIEVN